MLGILLSTVLTNFTHANANERSSKDIERDNYRKGPEVVDLVALKPGMKVLDLLGGGGYYSELIAKQVGDSGVVYLHNNNAYLPYVKEQLATRFADNRLNNVVRYDKELNQINEELEAQRDEIEKQKRVVEVQRDDIVASINYAKRIQNAILPSPSEFINSLN